MSTDTPIHALGSVQEQINAYWNLRAGEYEAHQAGQLQHGDVRRAWESIWTRALPEPPARVLDVGTGTGHVSLMLAHRGHQVTGIDLAADMLAQARRKAATMANAPVLEIGDASDPRFPARSFDAITCRYVLWTLRRPTVVLRGWRNLLVPGGRVAVVDSTWFPAGIHDHDWGSSEETLSDFRRHYDPAIVSTLPLAEASTIDHSVEALRSAGYAEVTVEPLHDVLVLDHRLGVAAGHQPRMQYLITGRA